MTIKAMKITSLFLASLVFLMAFFASPALAESAIDAAKGGLKTSGASAGFAENRSLTDQVSSIISAALSFLGVIFVILMIYGGFLWMTARGDEGQVTKAKDLITAAVLGLIVVVSAYAISVFVVSRFSEGTLN